MLPFCVQGQEDIEKMDSNIVVDSLLRDSGSISLKNEIQSPKKTAEQQFSTDLNFVQYLIANELFSDALLQLDIMQTKGTTNRNQLDSVYYYQGWINYFSRHFEKAIQSLRKIDDHSNTYIPAAFFTATSFLYLNNQDSAKFTLLSIYIDDQPKLLALRQLQLSGIALLQRDYESYDSITKSITIKDFNVQNEEKALDEYKSLMIAYKRKSPLLAGFLSALVPGMGKFYVGYRGTPFGALAMNLPLAAITIETLIISGWTGIPFLIAVPVFGLFYVGNIWGSVLSVYAHEREFFDEMDHNIMYDLHIPLRRVLN